MKTMPQKIKRVFQGIVVVALAFVLFFHPNKAQAQAPWFAPSSAEYEAALRECVEGQVGLECTVTAIVNSIIHAGGFGMANTPSGNRLTYQPGAIFIAGHLIGGMIANPPVSSQDFVRYVAQRANLVEPVYAQGAGFQALSPLIPIWAAIRNTAYLAFVIIFIIIGFMIMFRARLDPQTVVNIQNSLPKLVMTLILITFSFAIAGFMIDLIYLGIFLVVSILASQGLIENSVEVRNQLIGQNIFQVIFTSGIWRLTSTAGAAVQQLIDAAFGAASSDDTLLGSILGGLAGLILKGALLFAAFKLFFQLLLTYIEIILTTIFSPLLILLNALPGSQSFGNWLRNFLANVLIFPAIAMLFLIGAILLGPCDSCPPGEPSWQVSDSLFPPNETIWLPPFVGLQGTDRDSVLALIGFGIILFAPQLVTVMKQTLKAKPLPVSGVFAPIAASAGVISSPIRGIGGAVSTGVRTYFGQKVESFAGEAAKGR